jgi:hypothetical protein
LVILAWNKIGKVPKYKIIPTIKVSVKKYIALMKKSGSLGTLFNIFLIILPLLVEYPVFITIASAFPLSSKTLAPS